jgi:SAM-dependent methyltransferase
MGMRRTSYLQKSQPTFLDLLGMKLTTIRIGKLIRKKSQGTLLDVGCGYNASLTNSIWNKFQLVYLSDLKINKALKLHSKSRVILLEGSLPNTLKIIPKNSVDLIFANNIIEHLDKPSQLIADFRRIIKSDSLIYINVPSWTGKIFLEFAAFKLGLASKVEMEDHKNYYDKKSLWTLVRNSGFLPSQIKIKYTKLGMNTTCWITNAK